MEVLTIRLISVLTCTFPVDIVCPAAMCLCILYFLTTTSISYDTKRDGDLEKSEIYGLLRNSIVKGASIEEMDEMLRDMIEITVQKLMFFAYQFVESQLAIFFHTFNLEYIYLPIYIFSGYAQDGH